MHESLLGHSPSCDNCYSGYLKMDEGKNTWIEYWVVIREQQMLFYSDECSEESGEVAIKTIALSSETRCELLQRRNYHFRFKLLAGTASKAFRLKCSSAFHRQQWISHIMLASAKDRDRVMELNSVSLNSERNGGVHRRTVSTESQISSDAESLHDSESGLDSSGADGTFSSLTSESPEATPKDATATAATTTTTERRGSRSLLRRLSLKTSNRLRRNSRSSPGTPSSKDELGFSDMPSPKSPSSRKGETPLGSPKGIVEKVFVNPAFVPSPATSPSISRRETKVEQYDLIDISQPV